MKNNKATKIGESQGFIQMILLIVFILIILQFLGYNPIRLWQIFVSPAIEKIIELLLMIINFVASILGSILDIVS